MKNILIIFFIILLFSPAGDCNTLPKNLKKFLENKFPGISFKIDNSFILNNETFLPLIPLVTKDVKKIEIIEEIPKEGIKGPHGILYLTSPDSGKIIYLDLNNPQVIHHIQTKGAPWEISYDKTNKILFITDFAKDQIHQLKPNEETILKSLSLESMSSPKEIELSSDGSLAYILESLSNDFAVYKINEEKYFIKTKLPPNPTSFSLSKELNLVAITCPNTNSIAFLNTNDFSLIGQIMVDGGPEKVIVDSNSKIIYTANRNGNTISSIDPENKKIKNIVAVGDTPVSLALSPTRNFLYVGNGKSNTISIVNLYTNKLESVINLPVETQFPGDIEITTDGKWLITTSETTNTISVIDLITNKVASKLDVGVTTHSAYLIEEQ